jgi:hypothetical protein
MEKSLEIKVYDTITIVDTLVQALEYVAKVIEQWFYSDDEAPLTITLSKTPGRAPPVLSINVNDAVSAKGGLA